jgi:hypothetical protein
MPTVSPSQSNSGDTIEAADINTPVNQLAAAVNALDNNNIATGAGIDPSKLAGGSVSMLSAWQTWTPTLTNITLGTGSTVTGAYSQVGKKVTARLVVVLGTGGALTGTAAFTLPVTAQATYGTNVSKIGEALYEDVGVAAVFGSVYATNASNVASTTSARMGVYNAAGTYLGDTGTSATIPFTFGAGDKLSCFIIYEAA